MYNLIDTMKNHTIFSMEIWVKQHKTKEQKYEKKTKSLQRKSIKQN